MKIQMESLLNGKTIEVNFDEQIVFSHLAQDESAVWSLLVAGGYLKVTGSVGVGSELWVDEFELLYE